MLLNTPVDFQNNLVKYTHKHNFLLLGSCFSDEIGLRLLAGKIPALSNPFGTTFNPLSIFKILENKAGLDNSLIVHNQDLWFHHDLHSSIFGYSKQELNQKIEALNQKLSSFLAKTDVLILTFGTAFVHTLQQNCLFVGNCHKQPAQLFTKRILEVEEIIQGFDNAYTKINPATQIILNISPVRHTKDGIPENQLSKSTLRVACAKLEQKYSNVTYLPSYEKVLDDLRDYRFYKSDLIHPNELATDIIYTAFCNAFFSPETISLLTKIKNISTSIQHKPLYNKSIAYADFLKQLLENTKILNEKIDMSLEIIEINKLISTPC